MVALAKIETGGNLHVERLERLIEPARSKAIAMIAEANVAAITVCVVCTERTVQEQNALYAQGRTKPGKIVTHAKGGDSIHNYKLAWDLCPVVEGKLNWNRADLFNKLGAIAEKHSITWGGNFETIVDKPHFQFTGGLSLAEIKRGRRPAAKTAAGSASQATGKPDATDKPKLKTHEIVIEANGAPFSEEEESILEQRGGFKLYATTDRKKLTCQGSESDLMLIRKVAKERGWTISIRQL
jgi:peptidoglycan L-alanyl-D-glutamate endopeptidase CwlK